MEPNPKTATIGELAQWDRDYRERWYAHHGLEHVKQYSEAMISAIEQAEQLIKRYKGESIDGV